MLTDKTRTTVIAVVTTVWAANFVAGLIPALEYEPDQAINGIFMAIVGGLFALGARKDGGDPPAGSSGGGNETGGGSLPLKGADSSGSPRPAEEPS